MKGFLKSKFYLQQTFYETLLPWNIISATLFSDHMFHTIKYHTLSEPRDILLCALTFYMIFKLYYVLKWEKSTVTRQSYFTSFTGHIFEREDKQFSCYPFYYVCWSTLFHNFTAHWPISHIAVESYTSILRHCPEGYVGYLLNSNQPFLNI